MSLPGNGEINLNLILKPKTHWQIAEKRGMIDKERAAKVAGSRFAYIKGDLVRLQFALIQFGWMY
jgi:seryl-tRNA synthetase